MERFKISQVAKELGVTPAGVYKRLKTDSQLVENYIVREKRTIYLTREGVEVLRNLMQKTKPESDSTSFQRVENKTVDYLQELISKQQETIDNLIAKQSEERQRTDTIIMKLTHDLEVTRKSALAIESKVDKLMQKPEEKSADEIENKPIEEVKPWEPPKKASPDYHPLKKLWFELFDPAQLRSSH
jgi:plasmid maintenance system antidote protein VapI